MLDPKENFLQISRLKLFRVWSLTTVDLSSNLITELRNP